MNIYLSYTMKKWNIMRTTDNSDIYDNNNNNNNNKVTYKQRSLKKNSDVLQAYVIQCCGTGVPSGVVQKLPSTVTKDAGWLVGYDSRYSAVWKPNFNKYQHSKIN